MNFFQKTVGVNRPLRERNWVEQKQRIFNMDYGSICSGVEAAGLAWEKLGWKAKFFAEVEPFPSAVLMHRFGATKPLRTLDPDSAESE